MSESTTSNDKTAAIVSYITPIGWLISYFALNQPKSSLANYHLRQTLFLFIVMIAFNILLSIVAKMAPFLSLILSIAGLGLFVLWIMGLISAINGEEKPMPLIGEKAQEIFKNL
jgi:uncharacterized membrane protein